MSKVEEAVQIIAALGYPKAQQNERSALCLLALIQLQEKGKWNSIKNPLLGVRAILDFCREKYDRQYAENSRESFRKETLHQFVAGGLALQNSDDPGRAPNSPKWNYQISPAAKALLEKFGTKDWAKALALYLAKVGSLAENYKKAREFNLVRCTLSDGTAFQMAPGKHSELIKGIISEFAPRFAPGALVLYVGDTGNKGVVHDTKALRQLGVDVHERGKMPDVILHLPTKKWLLLVESVTSVGPVDGKRHAELSTLFGRASAGLVFVTAFPDRKAMAKFLPTIAWETEVWCADNPSHLIHFNGDRFLGPH